MPSQLWYAPLNAPQQRAVAAAAYTSSTTLTDVSPVPQFSITPDQIFPGMKLRFMAFGVFSTTGTPTLRLGIYWGGVAGVSLGDTGAVTTGSAVTNVPFQLEVETFIRTTGTSGSAISRGSCAFGTAVTAQNYLPVPNTALAAVTTNTTVNQPLTVGAQWGTSSASNTLTCHAFVIEG